MTIVIDEITNDLFSEYHRFREKGDEEKPDYIGIISSKIYKSKLERS